MKVLVLEAKNIISLKQVPIPTLESGWALVKVAYAAVCATDLELIAENIGKKIYPHIPGHEWSGIVQSVASEKDSRWIGKRVVGTNDVSCLRCAACRAGNLRYCPEFQELGFALNGAYAEYLAVPVYCLYELPETVSFLQGAMIEPLGVAIGCLQKGGFHAGQQLTVIGAGSIGLNIIALAKVLGAESIIAAAYSNKRLKLAEQCGANVTVATSNQSLYETVMRLHPMGSDLIVDTTADESCIQTCCKIAANGARIVLAGYGGFKQTSLCLDDIHIHNLQLIGAGNNWNVIETSLALLKNGVINTEHFASFITDIEDYEQALNLTKSRPDGFVKSVFKFDV